MATTDKPNAASYGDYGELQATTPVDSTPPPSTPTSSPNDVMDSNSSGTPSVGAPAGADSHNSSATPKVGRLPKQG